MSIADKIALFSALGGWLSGIGTLAAVITSLYIANKKVKVRLQCTVAERIIITPGLGDENNKEPGIAFEVVNHTQLPVTLTSLGWRVDKNMYWHQMLGDRMSHKLPMKLEYGEKAFFWVSLKNKELEWFDKIADEIKQRGGKAKTIECALATSTGGTKYYAVDKDLRNKVFKLVSGQ